ncbi:MAG: dihydropteroate synthase [Candidatus Omnitrophica bacterium]|nr:dihydropteroate synthase [Candidatus Omnitrophota bacterium]
MRILQSVRNKNLKKLMQEIRVDSYGVGIMLPKANHYLVRLNKVSNISANILKQEMLSLGGDVAVSRGALTGSVKKTDCLLMGTLSQFDRLNNKLAAQPFGLNRLAESLRSSFTRYEREDFILDLGRYRLNLGVRTHIMGILNITPDSFSGDGLLHKDCALKYAGQLIRDGADIIDVGGESTRPGARPVSLKEELGRVIPVIKLLSKKIKVPISVDTVKPQVAEQALDNGAVIVNDITGLKDPKMVKEIARKRAAVVIMHMKGTPRSMQKNTVYVSLLDEIIEYLGERIDRATSVGISPEKIIVDPGLGFAKSAEQNLEILNNLRDLKVLGQPILVGPSRKSFIGKLLKTAPQERIFGTVAASVIAAGNGAKIIRTHDCLAVKQALKVGDGINKS